MTWSANRWADQDNPRTSNARRHSRHDILVIAFYTIPCGGQTGTNTDIELFGNAIREPRRSYPKPEHGIPGHDSFYRLPGMLDPTAFQQ